MLKVNEYGGQEEKLNEKRLCFKGWETLAGKLESEKAMLKEKLKPNVDGEARWIKKMGKLDFGYKRHSVTDENGLVLAEEMWDSPRHMHSILWRLLPTTYIGRQG